MQDDDKNVDLSQNKVETASKHDTCENLLSNIQNQINVILNLLHIFYILV